MALYSLLVLLWSTYFGMVAYTAVPPVNVAVDQPVAPVAAVPRNTSALLTTALSETITFTVPGTQISIIFSKVSELISQSELDLCVIEAISFLFGMVLAKGEDGILPFGALKFQYGNVMINLHDFSAPAFRMTYALSVSVLRGIALYTSMVGYRATDFEVYNGKEGHVGTGEFGSIVPPR